MSEVYNFRYEITSSVMTDALRLYSATLLFRYRVVSVLFTVVGVVLALTVDFGMGVPVALVGLVFLATTWMEFADRWFFGRRSRGVVGGVCEYLVDDAGIHYRNPLGSGVYDWSALTAFRSNDKTVVFGRDRVMTAYVPTTAFTSPTERTSFLAFAKVRVGAPRQ